MTSPIARRASLGVVLLLLAHIPSALAGGLNLFWNDCSVSGVMNRTFACTNNTTNFDLYVSVDPPDGITLMTGQTHVIDLQSATATLPAWWEFENAGACRQTSLVVSTDFSTGVSGGTDCMDGWQGSGVATLSTYTTGFASTPSRARMYSSVSVPEDIAGPMSAGVEHYSIKLRVRGDKTVGAGSCDGCIAPVCLVLNEVRIIQLPGAPLGNVAIQNPLHSNRAYWQGAPYIPICAQVPAVNRTWGQVKSLYR